MPNASAEDVEAQRDRIREADEIGEETRESLLEASKAMGRHRSTWGHSRHESVLKRLIMLAWGGTKYDPPAASLADALEDKEAAGELVEWINERYENVESNRDMRNALRLFGKLLANDDPTEKDASPPPSLDWISATVPDNYDPRPNPANMISWEEVREMCEHPETNARDAALLAVAWDAGPRSGELEALSVGDVSDHRFGKLIHVDGKTGERDVTVTNAVPYLRQWLNAHPAPEAPGAPLWSKLKEPSGISYRMYRKAFQRAAARIDLDKPNDPTNFRKSSASALASAGVSQAHLEKRFGWKGGSDAASRYIRVFGEDADRELAEARGMEVDLSEPEPDGPKECKRCRVLIDAEAVKCDNCGFIQDREQAVEQIDSSGGTNVERLIRGAVRETIGDMLGISPDADLGDNPDPDTLRHLAAERSEAGLKALAVLAGNDELPDPDVLGDLAAELDVEDADDLPDVPQTRTEG